MVRRFEDTHSSRRLKKASLSAWDILANIWVVGDLTAESNRPSPEMEGDFDFPLPVSAGTATEKKPLYRFQPFH